MEAKKQGRWGYHYLQMSASWQDLEIGWFCERNKLNRNSVFTWCWDHNKQMEFKEKVSMSDIII